MSNTQIPKELTYELLGLVLDEEVVWVQDYIELGDIIYENADTSKLNMLSKNADTLTREMKEWCLGQGYSVWSLTSKIMQLVQLVVETSYVYEAKGNTELEAVTKATHYVAKEKGLL